MNRVTRMAIGLVALVPVLAVSGGLVSALGAGGETAGWLALGTGLIWIMAAIWWAMRAPPARSDEASARHWVALRHARYPGSHDASPHGSDDRAA